MDESLKRRVLNDVIDNIANVGSQARTEFERELAKYESLFDQDGPITVSAISLGSLDKAVNLAPELLYHVLRVWAKIEGELAESVRKYLSARGYPNTDAVFNSTTLEDVGTKEELESLQGEYAESYPGASLQDVTLMILCLTGHTFNAVTPEVELPTAPEAVAQIQSGLLNEFLDRLRQQDPQSEAWDEFDHFLTEAALIAEQARTSRSRRRELYDRLSAVVKSLKDTWSGQLVFFGASPADWAPDQVDFSSIESAIQVGNELLDTFSEYGQVEPKANTFAEELKRREIRNLLQDKLAGLIRRMSDWFTSGPPPSTDHGPGLLGKETDETGDVRDDESTMDSGTVVETDQPTTNDEPIPAPESVDEEPHSVPDHHRPEITNAGSQIPQADVIPQPDNEPTDTATDADIHVDEVPPTEASADAEPVQEDPAGEFAFEEPGESADVEELDADGQELERASARFDDSLLWELLHKGDVSGAYWLARAWEHNQTRPPVPSPLLAALEGASHLTAENQNVVPDLFSIVQENESEGPGDSTESRLLMLASGLYAALVAPASGLVGWLQPIPGMPKLDELVAAVKEFTNRGVLLSQEDLEGATDLHDLTDEINKLSEDAERWLSQANHRRHNLGRANRVWGNLVARGGELAAMMRSVASDDRGSSTAVKDTTRKWTLGTFVVSQIESVDLEQLKGRRSVPKLQAHALDWITRGIREATSIATRWADLVERERRLTTRGNRFLNQARKLRDNIQRPIPGVYELLDELETPSEPPEVSSAARCVRRTVDLLCDVLKIRTNGETGGQVPAPAVDDSANLQQILAGRLLTLPECDLTDGGDPTPEALEHLPQMLAAEHAAPSDITSIIGRWLEREDYRFVERLLERVQDPAELVEWSDRLEEEREGSRRKLKQLSTDTESAIEQAVVDGVLGDSNRPELLGELLEIDRDGILNFPPVYRKFANVNERIDLMRTEQLGRLDDQWKQLRESPEFTKLGQDIHSVIGNFLESAFKDGDTRAAQECISRVSEAVEGGPAIRREWFLPTETRDPLAEYLDEWRKLFNALSDRGLRTLPKAIAGGNRVLGFNFSGIPPIRRQEAAAAFEAWGQLKGRRRRAAVTENVQHRPIVTLLRFLGMDVSGSDRTALIQQSSGDDWAHLTANRAFATELAKPIPQFGSQAYGRLNVVCLWERPEVTSISARLSELSIANQAVLIIYLGRLTERQRNDLVSHRQNREFPAAILDETLMAMLAREIGPRTPAFLRCSLPYSTISPYVPGQAGDVPPEVFYGRQAMALDLQREGGSCIVYGGRQLGKSALLRHVQRVFSNKSQQQYAWVTGMQGVYDPASGKGTAHVFVSLRDSLKERGLLRPQVTTSDPATLSGHISSAFDKNPSLRVIAMFDETDAFLDSDARDNFRMVAMLRDLMTATGRRLKVVFTGLHNVQRFQGISNQPLAHFGEPINVGPLEPGEAYKLVEEPLNVLGYRFDNNATVLRILSYTNYHPGLIQYFCEELLKHMNNKRSTRLPNIIEQNDVDEVYRMPSVREMIRKRFEWTLELDTRYKLICNAIVYEQLEMDEGYIHPYSVNQILDMVREHWPRGSATVTEDMLRSLLDELVGLGVLIRESDLGSGRYRLRSPNLVPLFGSSEDILTNLIEIHDRTPTPEFEPNSYHALLDGDSAEFSPLTHAQERLLRPSEFCVNLIFTSNASGARLMPRVFESFKPAGSTPNEYVVSEIPPNISDPTNLTRWLQRRLDTVGGRRIQILHYNPKNTTPENLNEMLNECLTFAQRRRARRDYLVINFVFDESSSAIWRAIDRLEREDIEDRAGAVIHCGRWTRPAIRNRMERAEKLFPDTVCEDVLDATGGWQFLLDELFGNSASSDDMRPFAKQMAREIANPGSAISRRFLDSLGATSSQNRMAVLRFVASFGSVDTFEPELVESPTQLSESEIARHRHCLTTIGAVIETDDGEKTAYVVDPTVGRALGPL